MSPTLAGLHCTCACVCLLAAIYRKIAQLNFNVTKIKLMHSVGEGLLPECRVGDPEWRQLKLKHT